MKISEITDENHSVVGLNNIDLESMPAYRDHIRKVINAIYNKSDSASFVSTFMPAVDEFEIICNIILTCFESPDEDVDSIKEWIPDMLDQINLLNKKLGRKG